MDLFQSSVLAIVQGISEFLPISSSGHLNLFQHFFNQTPSLTFDIFLNTATLLSVLVFLKSKIKLFLANLPQIFIGSIPSAIVGIFFKDHIENIFANISLLPLFFLVTATFVFLTQYFKNTNQNISYKQALIIGLFQALAILPGVSRSGSTIFSGLLMGLNPLTAFNFSFFLFIPASLGALILDLKNILSSDIFQSQYLIAFIVTFLVGLLSLTLLRRLLITKNLWFFGFYSLFLASFLLFVL